MLVKERAVEDQITQSNAKFLEPVPENVLPMNEQVQMFLSRETSPI